ncbi:unnamed protein product [Schistosoma turkestanicum]|nr:unnamed protein product [Schistosoma turkestanicum]
MQTKDISHNLSQFNCNLSTITTTTPPQPTTTTDKLNSSSSTSSSFLITDILSSNNNIDQIEHLTNTNLSSTNQINSTQQQQNNEDIESFIVKHEDNINSMMMMTNTTHPIWQWLLDSFLSPLGTNESITRDEFLNKIKEKFPTTTTNNVHNKEILSHFSLQLNKQLCQYQSIEQPDDNATFKLNIDSLKQLSHEFWRLFQETSLNNNNNNNNHSNKEPNSKTCYNNEQLNHSNELKLFWTKSYEQYFRHTLLGQLKQTEHSIVNNNSDNKNNDNTIHIKNKIKRKEQKTIDLNNANIETIEQNDKLSSYHHHHHQPFTWFFNPMPS